MEDSGRERGEEDGQGNWLFRLSASAQEEGKSGDDTKQKGREQGVTIGAVKGEEGRRAEIRAQQIDISDDPCHEHGNRGGAREAWESGALEGVGGQGMSERIHDRVISQGAMSRQLTVIGIRRE